VEKGNLFVGGGQEDLLVGGKNVPIDMTGVDRWSENYKVDVNTPLDEVVVTGKMPVRRSLFDGLNLGEELSREIKGLTPDYKGLYDTTLLDKRNEGYLEWLDATLGKPFNLVSPTQYIGAARDAYNGNGNFVGSLLTGNRGLVSKEFYTTK